jgi:NAD(P)-dependent dehydrogenase (short-subunit alcohol dehydrogenase family)
MDVGLAGKVAIVTGASRGIGAATARLFAREGMKVALCSRGGDELEKVAAEIKAEGGEVLALPVDLGAPNGAGDFVASVIETFGEVNVLANVAGYHEVSPFLETTDADWNRVFENNFFGPMRACREVIPHMQRQGGGSIVNVSAASIRHPIKHRRDNHPHYTSAKAAFAMLSKYLSRDFARDSIRVNTILPAYAMQSMARYERRAQETGVSVNEAFMSMIGMDPDLARPGRPEEFANVILFLASDLSSYMTGATIPVDGGATDWL